MSRNNFLICLAGLPASGKTTFAKSLKGYIEKYFSSLKVKIIDPDIIRNSLISGNFDPTKEKLVRQDNLREIKDALIKDYIVISDDLNYYVSMRHDLKNISDKLNVFLFIIHISTPLEVCFKWNDIRGKPIPNEVIQEVYDKFDSFDKYRWDKPVLTVDLSLNQDLMTIAEKVMEKLNFIRKKFKFEPKSKKIISLETKYRQELDSITRQIVGDILRDSEYHPKSRQISKYRKEFIKQHSKLNTDLSDIPKLFRDKIKEILEL